MSIFDYKPDVTDPLTGMTEKDLRIVVGGHEHLGIQSAMTIGRLEAEIVRLRESRDELLNSCQEMIYFPYPDVSDDLRETWKRAAMAIANATGTGAAQCDQQS